MVNIEILEGLKQAMARGESLQRAMQSFLNAGYSQAEVEEASHNINILAVPQTILPPSPTQSLQKFPPLPTQTSAALQPSSQPQPVIQPQTQTPTSLQQSKKDIGVGWIILLIVVLFILIGALLGTISFKDSLAGFFNGLI